MTDAPTPDISDIHTLCVAGAGRMGGQIAIQAALHGYDVRLYDVDEKQLERATAENEKQVGRRVSKGRIEQRRADEALARVRPGTDLDAAADGADFVVEAIVEKLDAKRDLFRRLDAVAPAHAILATNSSYLGNSEIAGATGRPDKVVNMHFFYPPMVMKLVEVVRGPETSEQTVARTAALARAIGKEPVVIAKEIRGFLVNRILRAIQREAYFLYENGYASFADVDKAAELGLNHPLGPFKLADLSGLDVGYYARMAEYERTGDEADKPPASLAERVERGDLGRKTGKGFYDYSTDPPTPVEE